MNSRQGSTSTYRSNERKRKKKKKEEEKRKEIKNKVERGRHQLVRDYSIIERIYLYDGHTYLLLKYVYDRYVPTVYRTL